MVGYAPPGPTSLLRHLTANLGATPDELEAAGLARRREGGDFVDVFRDRVVFPIRDSHDGPIAFVGRRNPRKGDHDYAGPKYLNTRTTPAFTKGHALFGLGENISALESGALPVLVEGPLDALALTLSSDGAAVGITALGTALTARQVDLLRPYYRDDPTHITLATDADHAGWTSARRAYWHLTTRGADPTYMTLPPGLDPAQFLQQHGPAHLGHALANRRPLADVMVDQLLLDHPDWSNPATRLTLTRETGRIIAARPPLAWPPAIDRVTQRLHLAPGILHLEVLDQNEARLRDADTHLSDRLADIRGSLQARPRTATGSAARLLPAPAGRPGTDITTSDPAPALGPLTP